MSEGNVCKHCGTIYDEYCTNCYTEQEIINKVVKGFMDEAVPFLIKGHLGLEAKEKVAEIRKDLEKKE